MNVLLLSTGGGGGNILRSLKTSFRRDLAVTQQADSRYAERLKRAITTRFLDTNEFALSDVPKEEQLLIGSKTTGRLGARHDPDVARQALEESRSEVEALFKRHSIIVLLGTGGKGTGAGTMFPLTQIAREQKKLVIPIFVRPSFERHEVDKRHYDHAVGVIDQFDRARIRLIEILNDRGYMEADPQPQAAVWERMNLPIARGLRGLIYVLWDLSQVDPSDLSVLFAGHGRLRIGFAEIDPPAGSEPDDDLLERAAMQCCDKSFYAFPNQPGTSLICIQGDWSNVVDAKLKGQLAVAMGVDSTSPYSPLYARAVGTPKPWGVTALFAEYTGAHAPLDIDWSLERGARTAARSQRTESEPLSPRAETEPILGERLGLVAEESSPPAAGRVEPTVVDTPQTPSFPTFWEFAVAVNRSDPAALALAGNGAPSSIPVDGAEVRRLLATMWFRTVLARLSRDWHDRLLNVVTESIPVSDHLVTLGRRTRHLRELTYEQLHEVGARMPVSDAARADLDLLITVGRAWGPDAIKRLRFLGADDPPRPAKGESLLDRFLS